MHVAKVGKQNNGYSRYLKILIFTCESFIQVQSFRIARSGLLERLERVAQNSSCTSWERLTGIVWVCRSCPCAQSTTGLWPSICCLPWGSSPASASASWSWPLPGRTHCGRSVANRARRPQSLEKTHSSVHTGLAKLLIIFCKRRSRKLKLTQTLGQVSHVITKHSGESVHLVVVERLVFS